MKLLLALILLGGLAAAAVLVPVSGETAWHHAERKGWPLAAAQGFARAANSGARWAADALQGHPDVAKPPPSRGAKRRLARIAAPAGGTTAGAGIGIARAAPPTPHVAAPLPARVAVSPPAGALPGRLASASPVQQVPAAGTRDRIVAAAPAERLDTPDRAALDKLITARAGR